MSIGKITHKPFLNEDKKLEKAYEQFNNLITDLNNRDLNDEILDFINKGIDELNKNQGSLQEFKKDLKNKQSLILKTLEKEFNLVAKNHYQNMWMGIGMASFGIPLGVVFGVVLDNMAFLGVGIPIGLSIGLVIGQSKDKEAQDEGRQLDIEI